MAGFLTAAALGLMVTTAATGAYLVVHPRGRTRITRIYLQRALAASFALSGLGLLLSV